MDKMNTGDGGIGVEILQKINTMITNNMLILGVLVLLLIALVLALYYFASSLIVTISNYNSHRNVAKNVLKGGDSLKDTAADNEIYPEPVDPDDLDPDIDLTPKEDPKKFMPRAKREFIKELELQNIAYNKEKTDILINDLNFPSNDDLVDDKVLYADYDDYQYTNTNTNTNNTYDD